MLAVVVARTLVCVLRCFVRSLPHSLPAWVFSTNARPRASPSNRPGVRGFSFHDKWRLHKTLATRALSLSVSHSLPPSPLCLSPPPVHPLPQFPLN